MAAATSAAAAAASTEEGIVWSERSTTVVGKRIWSAAASACGDDGTAVVEAIATERDWRHKYTRHVAGVVALGMRSPDAAYAQSKAALAALHGEFAFAKNGERMPLSDAIAGGTAAAIKTLTVTSNDGSGGGGAAAATPSPKVPIRRVQGSGLAAPELLEGEALVAQAQGWVDYGAAEQSVADEVSWIVDGANAAKVTDAVDNTVFVLLGATSALGPACPLLELGCTVAAVARPGAKLDALVAKAEGGDGGSKGVLLVPQVDGGDHGEKGGRPGLDILKQTPEVVAWLTELGLSEKYRGRRFCICSLVYLDGELHVRASVAMDAIATACMEALTPARVALSYLASPSTVFRWPIEAKADAERRWAARPWYARVQGFACNATVNLVPGTDDVYNGMMGLQGPSYILAKQMQLYRCIQARAAGATISCKFAPSGRTESMTHSATMAAALNGLGRFPPNVCLEAETASSFMAVLLLHDLANPEWAGARAAAPDEDPWALFAEGAFHGGGLRCAYTGESIGVAIVMLGNVAPAAGTAGLV